ncbi:MAG: hypothetical protein AAFU49_18705 [Pseudomonadota bacterium]
MDQDGTSRVSLAELGAYCDGELEGPDASRIEQALAEDPDLRAEMRAMMEDRAALAEAASLPEGGSADPMLEALAGRLEARLNETKRRAQFRRWAVGGVGALAVALAGWAGHAWLTGTALFEPGPAERAAAAVPGFVADAAGAHAIFADDTVHPVEFTSADEPVMQRWFRSHLGPTALIPHLEELGFDLVGGRLLGDAEGAMAQVLYENAKGDRVSLVFGKREVPGGQELKLVHVGKSYASYWREGEFSWAVVEDSPGADVSAVATHIAALIRATGR